MPCGADDGLMIADEAGERGERGHRGRYWYFDGIWRVALSCRKRAAARFDPEGRISLVRVVLGLAPFAASGGVGGCSRDVVLCDTQDPRPRVRDMSLVTLLHLISDRSTM